MSFANDLLWALIGLLMTIGGTLVEACVTNPPWNWSNQGIASQSLGVTYQVGAVLLTGCLGGKNAGALAQIAYLVIGLTFMPVFSHGGGLEYIKEPTFGYLVGFIPGAWVCGWLAFRSSQLKLEYLAFSAVCGLLVIHLCGIAYLSFLSYFSPFNGESFSLLEAIFEYSLSVLIGQLVIVCVVAVIALFLRLILFLR